jgi:hypothetical protein
MPVSLWPIGYNVLNWNTAALRSLSSFAAISSVYSGVAATRLYAVFILSIRG